MTRLILLASLLLASPALALEPSSETAGISGEQGSAGGPVTSTPVPPGTFSGPAKPLLGDLAQHHHGGGSSHGDSDGHGTMTTVMVVAMVAMMVVVGGVMMARGWRATGSPAAMSSQAAQALSPGAGTRFSPSGG